MEAERLVQKKIKEWKHLSKMTSFIILLIVFLSFDHWSKFGLELFHLFKPKTETTVGTWN